VGSRAPADPGCLAAQVLETHGTARVDGFSTLVGTVGDLACAAGFGSGCAAPIVVNGELCGKMCVFSGTGTVLPARTEGRLYNFIELVATAISNYEARAELAASEARALELANEQAALRRVATLVAEGAAPQDVFDAVRREVAGVFDAPFTVLWRFDPDGIHRARRDRRLERDDARRARRLPRTRYRRRGRRPAPHRARPPRRSSAAARHASAGDAFGGRPVPTGQEHLKAEVGGFADRVTSVIDELREMSRGIHLAVLSKGGLSPALEALALRSGVPVKLNVRHEQRPPDAVEVAAYYVASEALTNVSKHADASLVELDLHLDDASLRLSIRDDGCGGRRSEPGIRTPRPEGSRRGARGTIDVESPHGTGTRLRVAIPVRADSSAG
jgi:signal transduction histidine kinase